MPAPRKPDHEKYRTPVRQLGRINDAEWAEIQQAVARSGKTWTAWAKQILLRVARRENAKQKAGGLAAIMGKWPGDESDEQVQAALENLS